MLPDNIKKWRFCLLFLISLLAGASPTAANDASVPMRFKLAGTYYVEGQIAGLGTVEFLVDTGSGYTAISQTMLERLRLNRSATFLKQLIGVMADGSERRVPVYLIPEIRLGDCVIHDVEAAVFAGAKRPILGMRSLSKVSPFTFSTSPPALQLGSCVKGKRVAGMATKGGVNMAKMEPPADN